MSTVVSMFGGKKENPIRGGWPAQTGTVLRPVDAVALLEYRGAFA